MRAGTKRVIGLVTALALLLTGVCTDADAAARNYKFKYKKVTVTMHAKADKLIAKMGKVQPKVTKSCKYGGDDYQYTGKDFVLGTYTNTKGGQQYVQSIKFLTSAVKTAEGVKIGSTETKVKDKYGKEAVALFGMYHFDKGKTRLDITVEDGKVTAIEYLAK